MNRYESVVALTLVAGIATILAINLAIPVLAASRSVDCGDPMDHSYINQCGQGTSDLLTGSTGNNQYQSEEEEEEEYGASRESNEIQGSQAYQQCIGAAADVGDKLSDYEIRNCQEDPSYRH